MALFGTGGEGWIDPTTHEPQANCFRSPRSKTRRASFKIIIVIIKIIRIIIIIIIIIIIDK